MNIDFREQNEYIEKLRKINEGKNLKYAVLTMGCQLNENDSERISGMAESIIDGGNTSIDDCLDEEEVW